MTSDYPQLSKPVYNLSKSVAGQPLCKSGFDFDGSYKPLDVSFMTNKVRGFREWLAQRKLNRVSPRDLPVEIGHPLAQKVGRDPDGMLSLDRIDKWLAAQPRTRYNHSDSFGQYNYIQRHSNEPSNLFYLNMSNAQQAQLQQAGVWDSYMNMHNLSKQSHHPVVPGTLGWVRWTGNNEGIHVDEVQSDYGRPWSDFINDQLGTMANKGQITQAQVEQHRQHFLKLLPDEHLKVIQKIVFGNKHPAEVLHEGFQEYLRSKGFKGTPIHIWQPEAKGVRSDLSPERRLPGHMQMAYRDIPNKMGWKEEGVYGEIPTQSNPENKTPLIASPGPKDLWVPSNKTYKDVVKKEIAHKALESLAKAIVKLGKL